ncbi:chemotaxis protein CheW [Undibacterium sp. TJN19]|uniref:chemotaxis protein CheW n=1 Tax=Undibacterium sp. TJN19 TaxID=3413055 RepID=UPI003BF1DBED
MGAAMPGMKQEVRNRILLRIDGLKLMLPQGDICAVESVSDMNLQEPPPYAAGRILYLGQSWPVISMNAEFQALDFVPAGRRACVMLATGAGFLGLLCDDVRVLNQLDLEDFALPMAMRAHNTPIHALMHFEAGLACLSDAGRLLKFGVFAAVLHAQTTSRES